MGKLKKATLGGIGMAVAKAGARFAKKKMDGRHGQQARDAGNKK
jgi:hypothetical protein